MLKPYICEFRVYYEDTDAAGIVYHANYLKYMERARTEHLISLQDKNNEKDPIDSQFVVTHVEMDFKKGAKLFDKLVVVSEIKKINRASLVYHQKVVQKSDESVIFCQSVVKLACVSSQFKPKALPQYFQKGAKS